MPSHFVDEFSVTEKLTDDLWKYLHEHDDCKVSQVIPIVKKGSLASIIIILEQEDWRENQKRG